MTQETTPPPLRVTSGAGFDFEDRISAWLMVRMLRGTGGPAIDGKALQLQAQVGALGWRLDDLLYTLEIEEGKVARLAISAKGNVQVASSSLPADFVNRAWEQWNKPQPEGPMNRSNDFLVLATLDEVPEFTAAWREVTNACSGSDVPLGISRIRANPKQSRVFDSVKKHTAGAEASDDETVALIRRLRKV